MSTKKELGKTAIEVYDFLNEVAIRKNTGLDIDKYLKVDEKGLLEVDADKLEADFK